MRRAHLAALAAGLVASGIIVELADARPRDRRDVEAAMTFVGYSPATCFTLSPGINDTETVIYIFDGGVLSDCSSPVFGSYPRQVTLVHQPNDGQYEVAFITGCDGVDPTAHTLSRGSPAYAYAEDDLVCVTGGVADAGLDASLPDAFDVGVGADGGDATADGGVGADGATLPMMSAFRAGLARPVLALAASACEGKK